MARILVIEDRATIGMLFNLALSQEGHHVEVYHNGKTGLERIYEEPMPELLIVDLHMPGISGKVVVETMHESAALRQIPVIIVSGASPGEDELPPKGSYQKFIGKPFDIYEVIETVELLTQKKQHICA